MSPPQGHGTVGRNMSLKNPVTPPGIDPGTVRLVAQRLNHYATPGPNEVKEASKIVKKAYEKYVYRAVNFMEYSQTFRIRNVRRK
jgi:hypothetical protein